VRKQVSPTVVAVSLLVTLGIIQALYWRGLLSKPPGGEMEMGGGGGMEMGEPPPTGLPEVQVTTLAGRPVPGRTDGPGWAARFNGPSAVAVDRQGRVFVTDSRNHSLRCITPSGAVETLVVGGPMDGLMLPSAGEERPRLWNPSGLAVGANGTVYIADTGHHRLCRLEPDGTLSVLAGDPGPRDESGWPQGGFRDGKGSGARFRYPLGLACDREGYLWVADLGNRALRRVSPTGEVVTVVGGPHQSVFTTPCAVEVEAAGRIYVADAGRHAVLEVTPEGQVRPLPLPRPPERVTVAALMAAADPLHPAPRGVRLLQPTGLAISAEGTLYLTDAAVHCLFRATPEGELTLLAGAFDETGVPGYLDGPGNQARFATPCGLTIKGGVLYVADFDNHCVREVRGILVTTQPVQPD